MSTENIATEAAPVTDNAAPEAEVVSTETAKPAEAKAEAKETPKAAVNPDEKAYRLAELISITEKDPSKKLSDEDQAIYEEWVDEKLAPKDRPKEPEAKKEEKAEKPVEKVEKVEIPPHIEEAMKKVGAKSPEELATKIDGLKALASGKESEAVKAAKSELERAARSEAALWRDFMEGKPEALQYVEKAYGLKPKAQSQTQQPSGDFDPDVLADADALTGGITSKVIAQNKALQERLEKLEGTFQGHQKTIQEQGVRQTVAAQVVDEMIAVSQSLDGIKDIPGLRNLIIDRVVHGKEDPRLDAFNEIFQIAQDSGTSLQNALLIKKGRDSDLLVARAREEGLKQAYGHKPNKSLSSIQTEDANPQSYTDSQYAEMSNDFRKIPAHFFDGNGELNKAKIPKNGWAYFGIE